MTADAPSTCEQRRLIKCDSSRARCAIVRGLAHQNLCEQMTDLPSSPVKELKDKDSSLRRPRRKGSRNDMSPLMPHRSTASSSTSPDAPSVVELFEHNPQFIIVVNALLDSEAVYFGQV
jgi:hypothetical protein